MNSWKVSNLPFDPVPDPDRGKYWPDIPDDWIAVPAHEQIYVPDGRIKGYAFRFFPYEPPNRTHVPLIETRGLIIVRDIENRIENPEPDEETFMGHEVIGKFDYYPYFHARELPEGSHRANWQMARQKALFYGIGYAETPTTAKTQPTQSK